MATPSHQRKNDNRGQKRRGGGSRNRRDGGEGRSNQNNSNNRGGRGGRNRSNRNSSATEGASSRQGQRPPRAPVGPTRRKALRPSLWQRIKAFFTGGSSKPDSKGGKTNGNRKATARNSTKSRDRDGGSNGQGGKRKNRNRKEAGTGGNSRRKQPSSATDGKSDGSTPGRKSSKPSRTPEEIEVTSGRLYVGNLSYDATEEDLEQLFNGVGTVTAVEVVSHRYTQRSKGYAFIELQSVPEAKRAVEELHDKDFMGRPLVVTGAKSRGVREGSETKKNIQSEEPASDQASSSASPGTEEGEPEDSSSSER